MTSNFEDGGKGRDDYATESAGNIISPKQVLAAAEVKVWTAADFLSSEPYPMPESADRMMAELEQARLEANRHLAGEGTLEVGGLPDKEALAGDVIPAATSGGYNYPAPYTCHEVICPYSTYPYITVGRIFFNQNGGTYNASAVSIGNYAIWTAGHCVHAGNGRADGWSTNLVFVPAYKDGQAPYGVWNASYLITRTNWYQNGHSSEDMGGAVLRPNSVGRKISEVVGWMGFAWNFSRFQHWTLLGYPSNPLPGAPPFNGERMYQNSASYAYSHAVTGVDTLGVGNRMSQGCSGGPWVLGFGTGNYVNGNNSYFNVNGYEEMFSPYFDNRAKSLKDDLVGGSP